MLNSQRTNPVIKRKCLANIISSLSGDLTNIDSRPFNLLYDSTIPYDSTIRTFNLSLRPLTEVPLDYLLQNINITKTDPIENPKKSMRIIMIVDATGSMMANKAVTISAYNEFLDTQRQSATEDEKNDKLINFTLCQFNTNSKFIESKNIKDAEVMTEHNYNPSGCTALYDAIGDTLDMYKREEANICVIITDGAENSSRKFTRDQVFKKIKEFEEKKEWMFHYLGANQDAFAVGSGINVKSAQNFDADTEGFKTAFNSLEGTVQAMRGYQEKKLKSKQQGEDLESFHLYLQNNSATIKANIDARKGTQQ